VASCSDATPKLQAKCQGLVEFRGEPLACHPKEVCEFLERAADERVTFAVVQSKHPPGRPDDLFSERHLRERHACLLEYLEGLGAKLEHPYDLAQGINASNVLVSASYRQIRPAYRLTGIDAIEINCEGDGDCAFCVTAAPGPACDELVLCYTLNGRQLAVDSARQCVSIGAIEPVACLDSDHGCKERPGLMKDKAGRCWYNEHLQCPGAAERGFVLEECVPLQTPKCE
jgi:hypothetical protein